MAANVGLNFYDCLWVLLSQRKCLLESRLHIGSLLEAGHLLVLARYVEQSGVLIRRI